LLLKIKKEWGFLSFRGNSYNNKLPSFNFFFPEMEISYIGNFQHRGRKPAAYGGNKNFYSSSFINHCGTIKINNKIFKGTPLQFSGFHRFNSYCV